MNEPDLPLARVRAIAQRATPSGLRWSPRVLHALSHEGAVAIASAAERAAGNAHAAGRLTVRAEDVDAAPARPRRSRDDVVAREDLDDQVAYCALLEKEIRELRAKLEARPA